MRSRGLALALVVVPLLLAGCTATAGPVRTVTVTVSPTVAAGLPTSVQQDVSTLAAASGTLEHPTIDLQASAVDRARNDIAQTCQPNSLTIGAIAQGG